jgi:two-component system, chemotaxis family, chemotaxis protein CheY
MKILIAEDDHTSRKFIQRILSKYGQVDAVENGRLAVVAFETAMLSGQPYNLICLDIMMPEMNGQKALSEIRRIEEENKINPGEGAKVIMTTALDDPKTIMTSFRDQCDAYVVKPILPEALRTEMAKLGFSQADAA